MNRGTSWAVAGAGTILALASLGFFLAATWHAVDDRATWKEAIDACPDEACRDAVPPAAPIPARAYMVLAGAPIGIAALVAGMALGPRRSPAQPRTPPRPPMDPANVRAWLLGVSAALLIFGVGARIATPWFMDVGSDGGSYAAIGHAISNTGTMQLPWGDVWTSGPTPPQPSHHYPPLYPLWLAGFYSVLGFGLWQTQIAGITMSLLALAVVYGCTRSLLGHVAAMITAGLVAVQGRLIWTTGAGFSENLTLILFTVTLWAILRTIVPAWIGMHATWDDLRAKTQQEERGQPGRAWWIVVGGTFAGLTYLARSTMGPFFLIAGAGGFAWRFWFEWWRVFSAPYLTAILAFAFIAGAWIMRNELLFGTWQGSGYNAVAQAFAFSHPALLLQGLAFKAALFAGFLGLYAWAFWPELGRARRTWRSQIDSCMILAMALVFVIGAILAAVYWTWEAYPIWWMDNERYAVIGLVPLLWLALRHARADRSLLRRVSAAGAVFVLAAVTVLAQTGTFPDSQAAAELPIHAGQQVGYEGKIAKYGFYTELPTLEGVQVYACHATAADPCPGSSPDFILSTFPATQAHAGFQVIRSVTHQGATITTWARAAP